METLRSHIRTPTTAGGTGRSENGLVDRQGSGVRAGLFRAAFQAFEEIMSQITLGIFAEQKQISSVRSGTVKFFCGEKMLLSACFSPVKTVKGRQTAVQRKTVTREERSKVYDAKCKGIFAASPCGPEPAF